MQILFNLVGCFVTMNVVTLYRLHLCLAEIQDVMQLHQRLHVFTYRNNVFRGLGLGLGLTGGILTPGIHGVPITPFTPEINMQ